MRMIASAIGVVTLCAAGLAGQTSEVKEKTKLTVKDGKEVTVTGCLERNPGGGYMLTHGGSEAGMRYLLVTGDDFSKHVGHRVEVHGKATDQGKSKVKIESKTTRKVEHGDDKETKAKTELKGDMPGLPLLGVKSLKMISSSCP